MLRPVSGSYSAVNSMSVMPTILHCLQLTLVRQKVSYIGLTNIDLSVSVLFLKLMVIVSSCNLDWVNYEGFCILCACFGYLAFMYSHHNTIFCKDVGV